MKFFRLSLSVAAPVCSIVGNPVAITTALSAYYGVVTPNFSISQPLFVRVCGGDPPNPSDDAWNKAVYKGKTLMKQMLANDHDAGQMFRPPRESAESEFLTYPQDLDKWGYSQLDYDPYYDFDNSLPLKPALNDLGVSDKKFGENGGNNWAWVWEHDVEKIIDGTTYPVTEARYTTVLNPVDGVIFAWGKYSPGYMGSKKTPPVTVLPRLKSWSDIAFLQWWGLTCTTNPRNLHYVFSTPVENTTTQAIISRAISTTGNKLTTWPGVTFGMDTDQGKAILAAPNGVGVAFLLSSHKRQMGAKVVEKVTVFQDAGKAVPRPPSLLFYIKDALPSKEGNPAE
ncbi:uncharacterized protein BDR25DRAFT_381875 [Lindgomyces ingoldianus]|uniref:Uncharacterized protein n=1 Tax=Lindgomyces ingoldianus TaxID=673940 RepID=A0ACB6R8L6_9PLEO|nr:uncharacterized protein BDR25DRAFT_381875 [Lindgomyces ingoldianus]KAF2475090.1 hypothetical protein BDR25DRAFT_381875 [Lindgomyces ingoldianus]